MLTFPGSQLSMVLRLLAEKLKAISVTAGCWTLLLGTQQLLLQPQDAVC